MTSSPNFSSPLHMVSPVLRASTNAPKEENSQQTQLPLYMLFPSGIFILLVFFTFVVIHTVFENIIL